MAKSWYALLGGNPTDVTNYFKITNKHNCLCGDKICAIYATDDPDEELMRPMHPLSPNMQLYIKDALATGYIQPDIPFDARKYVYLRY
ncbi:hypothetical protein [Pedobacter lusitanus]|nr:hypothetical protein [Pedobacter lusitanus]